MRPGQAVCRPVVVLAIGVSLLLSGCSKTSQEDLDKAKAAGASEEAAKLKQKTLEEEQARLAAEVKRLQAEASKSASATATATTSTATVTQTVQGGTGQQGTGTKGTSCGGNLSVGPNTTCAFAANVRAAFYAAGGGNVNVDVYSPVTGRYYTMYCVAGVPSVCRGGNNAVVYIR
jgi:hypothetical protein